MGTDIVAQVGTEALKTVLFVSAPLLSIAIVVGLLVSILQAITQIQDIDVPVAVPLRLESDGAAIGAPSWGAIISRIPGQVDQLTA